jgi:hypothetical protein
MIQKIKNKFKSMGKSLCSSQRMKTMALMLAVGTTAAFAQNAAGDYSAGTTALGTVTTEIAKYIPYVVKLCYAIAGIVAVVGAISVYIKMNNEELDVKNILVLQNRQETRRKEMKLNSLLYNTLCRYFNFPIFENVVLKNI